MATTLIYVVRNALLFDCDKYARYHYLLWQPGGIECSAGPAMNHQQRTRRRYRWWQAKPNSLNSDDTYSENTATLRSAA